MDFLVGLLIVLLIIQTVIYTYYNIVHTKSLKERNQYVIDNSRFNDSMKSLNEKCFKLERQLNEYYNGNYEEVKGILLYNNEQFTVTQFHIDMVQSFNKNMEYKHFKTNDNFIYTCDKDTKYIDRDGALKSIEKDHVVVFKYHIGDGKCIVSVKGELIDFSCNLLKNNFKLLDKRD